MTNVNKLKGKLKEYGMTINDYAEELNLNVVSAGYKVNGKKKFNQEEIEDSITLFNLSPDEVVEIFFTKQVGKTQQSQPRPE